LPSKELHGRKITPIHYETLIRIFELDGFVVQRKKGRVMQKNNMQGPSDLQRDVVQIKKSLLEEPELREDFILRMQDIDLEKSIVVKDFGKRYGLKR